MVGNMSDRKVFPRLLSWGEIRTYIPDDVKLQLCNYCFDSAAPRPCVAKVKTAKVVLEAKVDFYGSLRIITVTSKPGYIGT